MITKRIYNCIGHQILLVWFQLDGIGHTWVAVFVVRASYGQIQSIYTEGSKNWICCNVYLHRRQVWLTIAVVTRIIANVNKVSCGTYLSMSIMVNLPVMSKYALWNAGKKKEFVQWIFMLRPIAIQLLLSLIALPQWSM